MSGIQMVGLSGIQMAFEQIAFENQIIWHSTSLRHSNTRLVWYSDTHFSWLSRLSKATGYNTRIFWVRPTKF